ncbi:MAG: ABC transporter permease [Marinilabiliales bacterium]|nr:ABC transporter permease [Marinilabiliales bacterium]
MKHGYYCYFYPKQSIVASINFERFVARRIFSDKENKKRFSRSILSFALFGIAFGMAIMILSVAIVTGFKKEIRNKVIGFGAHIQLENFDSNTSFETLPIQADQPWLADLRRLKGIQHLSVFGTKPGIIKTDGEIAGMILKGVGTDFDWTFFKSNLVEGNVLQLNDSLTSDKVMISATLAVQLRLKLGDPLYCYFLDQGSSGQRMRRFYISGIYRTSLEEFDKLYVLGDIQQIRKLYGWDKQQVSGYEIMLENFDQLNELSGQVKKMTLHYSDSDSTMVRAVSITSRYPQIFDWLNLLDMNVWIILGLILVVAGFNMVSGLLILILERTSMIGTLKALGCHDFSIRKVFLYLGLFLIGRGMLWGNLVGIGICILQTRFGLFRLDATTYYLEYVPVNLQLSHLLLLNFFTLLLTFLMLLLPSWYISRISPDKALRFD